MRWGAEAHQSAKVKWGGVTNIVNGEYIDLVDKKALTEFRSGLEKVLEDFGIDDQVSINGSKYNRGVANVNGLNQVRLPLKIWSSYENALQAKKNNTGITVTTTLSGTGAHEAGHIVANALYKRRYPTVSEAAPARHNKTIEKEVIKAARKRVDGDFHISKYASENPAETVAEAVADVYSNGKAASKYSKAIVDVLKEKIKKN